jgi:hypothetical protein
MILESPKAIIDLEQHCISGSEFIHIGGKMFTAMGVQWTFFGRDESIFLEKDVRVFFETNLGVAMVTEDNDNFSSYDDNGFTVISGDALQISPNPDGHVFDFLQNVEIKTNDFRMNCDRLEVCSSGGSPMRVFDYQLGGECVARMKGTGNVCMQQSHRSFFADCVELFPREGVVLLSGCVNAVDNGDHMHAEKFILRRGEKHVLVGQDGTEQRYISFEIP